MLGREGRPFPAEQRVHRLEGNGIPCFPLTLVAPAHHQQTPWIHSIFHPALHIPSSPEAPLTCATFHSTPACIKGLISPQSPIELQQKGAKPRGLEGKATQSCRILYPITTENKKSPLASPVGELQCTVLKIMNMLWTIIPPGQLSP